MISITKNGLDNISPATTSPDRIKITVPFQSLNKKIRFCCGSGLKKYFLLRFRSGFRFFPFENLYNTTNKQSKKLLYIYKYVWESDDFFHCGIIQDKK